MANVFFFGASERRLFGVYDAPAKGKRKGVVLCNPLGAEYYFAHQSLHYLGQLLADEGTHVMRFDWFGCGDSAGAEPGDDASRLEDLDWAIDELKDTAGVRKVDLVGLRAGAGPALAAAKRKDVSRIVLWDPVAPVTTTNEKQLLVCHEDDASRHGDNTDHAYAGPRAWNGDGDFGSAGMPVNALRAITEWLT